MPPGSKYLKIMILPLGENPKNGGGVNLTPFFDQIYKKSTEGGV